MIFGAEAVGVEEGVFAALAARFAEGAVFVGGGGLAGGGVHKEGDVAVEVAAVGEGGVA